MQGPEKNSYKEFDNEIPAGRKFPFPPPLNFSNGPSLTRFLPMAEVAEVEDSEVTIDCVAIFYEEGKISLDAEFRVKKNGL